MFAFPLEEDIINGLINKDKIFYIISLPLNYGSTEKLQSTHLAPESIKKASFKIFGSNFGEIRNKFIKEIEIGEDLKKYIEFFDKNKIEEGLKNIINKLEKNNIGKNYKKNNEDIFIFLGGNHLISYFTIKVLKPDLVIHFDAHSDTDPVEKELKHSNFMRFLLNEEDFKLIQIGLSNTTKEEFEYIKKNKKVLMFKRSIDFYNNREHILKEVLKNITKIKKDLKNIKNKKELIIYITIDLDVFESFIASYQGESLGIKIMDFLIFMKNLVEIINKENNKNDKNGIKIKIKGLDLVELNPHMDFNGYWSMVSARILIELISML